MDIIIKNCNLISMSEKRDKYEPNIDIYISDGYIKEIGHNLSFKNIKVIDAKDLIVMPGLINCHAHIPMSIFKETIDGLNLQDWLNKKIWPIEDKLTDNDVYIASLTSIIEMIKTGTTTVNDHYFMVDKIIEAGNKIGINLVETVCLLDIDGKGQSRYNNFISFINKYDGEIYKSLGLHSLYTCSDDIVSKGISLANKENFIVHMHYKENSNEINDIYDLYGVKPEEILNKYFKDTHNVFAHAVKVNNEDLEFFKKTNSHIVHCPISNLKLGCGIAPIAKMNSLGINVCLGTDGAGSGSNMDMFEVMKYTSLLQKGSLENPMLMDSYEVLKMATVNGAKALKIDNRGIIDINYKADLIILDLNDIITKPINNIMADIVYNAKGYNVLTSIINGNIIMENRKLNINEKDIIDECQKITDRLMEGVLK